MVLRLALHLMWHFPELHIDQPDFSSLPNCHRSLLGQRLQSCGAPVSQWVFGEQFRCSTSRSGFPSGCVCTTYISSARAAAPRNTKEQQLLCAHLHLIWKINHLSLRSWFLCEKKLQVIRLKPQPWLVGVTLLTLCEWHYNAHTVAFPLVLPRW